MTNKTSTNIKQDRIIWSQRDALILAKTFPENKYPFNGYRVGVGLTRLDQILIAASQSGNDLVKEFQAFCAEHGEIGLQLQSAVRAANPLAPIPEQLADIFGWNFRTLDNAYAERKPTQYVVGQLFALPSLNIVYGAPGCLKSMLLADMAVCVAGGLDWLEPLPESEHTRLFPTLQKPVLWIDFDNGARRTDDRFGALARARGLPPDVPLYYASMPSPWLDASNPEEVEQLRWRIQALDAAMVVIDNLGTVCGDADENSSAMIKVLGNFRHISEETGAAVVLIHHQRKASGFSSRAGESLRGHSSIEAALDLALLIQRDDEQSPTLEVKSTKTRDIDVWPFAAMFTFEHRTNTNDLHKARFWGIGMDDDHSYDTLDAAIYNALRGTKLNQTQLIDAIAAHCGDDFSKKRIRERVLTLQIDHKISAERGARNSVLYSI